MSLKQAGADFHPSLEMLFGGMKGREFANHQLADAAHQTSTRSDHHL